MHQHHPRPFPQRLARTALLLVTTLLLLTACGRVSVSADEHLSQAQQAFAKGDLRSAIIEVKNALQQAPSRADARQLLGEYSLELGNAVEAEAELLRAQELGADPDALRLPLLRAWLMQGKHAQVLAATESADWPDAEAHSRALTQRALALLAQQRVDEARAANLQALELQADNTDALLGMAWVEWLSGNPQAARASLDAAIAQRPQSDRAWELLGDLEREAGQLEQAESAYSKALETSQQPFAIRFKRALTRLFRQDFSGAEADAQALNKQFGEQPGLSYLRGLIAFYQQSYTDARIEFEQTLSQTPDYLPAMFYLGATQFALENPQQAESYLSRYLSRVPDSSRAARLLALTRLQEGNSQGAEQTLNAVLKQNAEDTQTLAMVSNLFLAQGRADEALHHLRRVIALEPESAASRLQLGVALVQDGQREEGFSELERALQLAPEQSAQLEVAMILERLRAEEYQQALELIERLRDRDDVNPALYYNLKGLALIRSEDLAGAEQSFRDGLAKVPQDNAANIAANLVGLLARDGRADEATQLANQYIQVDPNHLGLLTHLAQVSASQGDLEQSEQLLRRALEANGQSLRPRLALAQLYLASERTEQAVELLREGEAIHGESLDWLRLASLALVRHGQQQEAIETLERFQQRQPELADPYFMLGGMRADLGELPAAFEMLQQGLTRDPSNLTARLLAVRVAMAENQLEQAATLLQPALAEHPDDTTVLKQSAVLAARQERIQEAITTLERARTLEPDNRDLASTLAQAQWRAGDQTAAQQSLIDWLQQHPDDQGIRLQLANTYLAQGRDPDAVATFERIVAAEPDNSVALNNLAWLLRETDTARALGLAQQAVALAPRSASMLDTLGLVQLLSGDAAQAVTTLKQASAASNNDPTIQFHLAKALAANGERDQAKTILGGLLEQFPQFGEREQAQQLFNDL